MKAAGARPGLPLYWPCASRGPPSGISQPTAACETISCNYRSDAARWTVVSLVGKRFAPATPASGGDCALRQRGPGSVTGSGGPRPWPGTPRRHRPSDWTLPGLARKAHFRRLKAFRRGKTPALLATCNGATLVRLPCGSRNTLPRRHLRTEFCTPAPGCPFDLWRLRRLRHPALHPNRILLSGLPTRLAQARTAPLLRPRGDAGIPLFVGLRVAGTSGRRRSGACASRAGRGCTGLCTTRKSANAQAVFCRRNNRSVTPGECLGDEDRRSAVRSPSLPNRTGRSPASGFPVGSRRWAGSGKCSEMFGGNTPAARSLRTRSPGYGRPTASRRASAKRLSAAPTRTALRHYVGPCEMASVRLPALPSYPPSLHDHYSLLRYYGGSDPGRPFGHHPPWFPDSRHPNFPSFCLQPSAALDQTRSTASTLAALFCSGFALHSQARQNRRPNRVHSVCPGGQAPLRTEGSLPVALHPGVWPRCSYFQLLALQCRPGQGLSPCCSSALSGARARPSSGAAMLESDGKAMKSGASGYPVLAAPEDGRTPPISRPPSLTHYRRNRGRTATRPRVSS